MKIMLLGANVEQWEAAKAWASVHLADRVPHVKPAQEWPTVNWNFRSMETLMDITGLRFARAFQIWAEMRRRGVWPPCL